MPEHQGVKKSRSVRRLRAASRIAGLLSVLVPVVIYWGSYSATKSGEKTCGMVLLAGIMGGAASGSILSLSAVLLGIVGALCVSQPRDKHWWVEISILGLPLTGGLIFFAALFLRHWAH